MRTSPGKIYSRIGLCKRGCFSTRKSFAFLANSRCTSGLTQKPGSPGKLFPFICFTELEPTINIKCFSLMTWQVDGVCRINHKSSLVNSSNNRYTEISQMSKIG